MSLVSVIIPAYNCAATIRQTIQSVFEGQNIDLEIIVVNDGSTDDTEDVLKDYEQKCRIIHTQNEGAGAARQKGLALAKGKFIQYLDADDLLMPGKLDKQMKALDASGADIAYGDWQRFTIQNEEIIAGETIKKTLAKRPELALFTADWWPPAALLLRKTLTDKLKWQMQLPVIQDARYMLDASLAGARFVHTPDVVALYRTHQQQSLSARSEKAFVTDCFLNARDMYALWKKDLDFDPEKKAALLKVLRFAINRLTVLDPQLAKEAVNLLMKVSPDYIPHENGALRALSQLFGYPKAESVAAIKRRFLS